MSYMSVFETPVCNFMACAAGLELAVSGVCFLNGEYDNPDCPKFEDEFEFIARHEEYWEEEIP
jgi:hypothetical protein